MCSVKRHQDGCPEKYFHYVGQLQTEGSTPWVESGEGFPILYLPLPNLEGSRQTGLHYAHRAIYMLPPHLLVMFLGMGAD